MSSTPNKGDSTAQQQDDGDGSIMGSIAALKSILMMDTPTKTILGRSANISLQQTRYEERRRYEEKIESLQVELEHLESKSERTHQELAKEKSVRKTLETTHEALLKHRKEMMLHMELLKNSRGKLEDKIAETSKSLKSTIRTAEESTKTFEKQIQTLAGEKDTALASAADFESKYNESQKNVQDLENSIAKLKADIEDANQRHGLEKDEHSRLQNVFKEAQEEAETWVKKTVAVLGEARTRIEAFRAEASQAASPQHRDPAALVMGMQQAVAGLSDAEEGTPSIVTDVATAIILGLTTVLEEIKESQAASAELKCSLEVSQSETQQSRAELAASQEECGRLQSELDSLGKVVEAKEKEDEMPEEQPENKRSIDEVESEGGDADQEDAKRPKANSDGDIVGESS